MTEIIYSVGENTGSIYWAVAEYFNELQGTAFHLNQMAAVQIAELNQYSLEAKILLSAVAGAVIQHLIDQEVTAEQIFNQGTFTVQPPTHLFPKG